MTNTPTVNGTFVTTNVTDDGVHNVRVAKRYDNGVTRRLCFSYTMSPEAVAAVAKLHQTR